MNGVKPGDAVVKYTKAGCNKCTYVSLNQNPLPKDEAQIKIHSIHQLQWLTFHVQNSTLPLNLRSNIACKKPTITHMEIER